LVIFGDEVAAIKALSDFIKKVQLPIVKLGLFDGRLATVADFNKLASLPTRDVLLATLAARLKSPLFGLHYGLKWDLNQLVYALNAVKSKKPN
jgi:large subunit ribosomal protein L10